MKIGIVLEGGGLRGVFASAVVDFLIQNRISFPYIIGTSSGAFNGLCLRAKQHGRIKRCLSYDSGEIKAVKKFLDSKKKTIYSRVYGNLSNKAEPYDLDAFFSCDGEFETVVTDCDSGMPAYLTERASARRFWDILYAANSSPAIESPVTVDGCSFVDGCVTDPIPFKRAFERGCDKVVVVLTSGIDFDPNISSSVKMLFSIAFRKNPLLYKALCNAAEKYRQSIAEMNKLVRSGKIFVIRPDIMGVSTLEAERSALEAYYAHGLHQINSVFPEFSKFIST